MTPVLARPGAPGANRDPGQSGPAAGPRPEHLAGRAALLALVVAALVVLSVALGAQRSFEQLESITTARMLARETRLKIAGTLSLFKDLETGSRGFALSGREPYLTPYLHAKQALPRTYEALRAAVHDQDPGVNDWAELDALVARRIALADAVVEARRREGGDPVAEGGPLDEGKAAMDALRARFAAIDQRQRTRIETLQQRVVQLRTRARVLTWSAALGAVALIVASLTLLARERRARRALEARLRAANDTLETQVAARTRELADARDRIAGFAGELELRTDAERRRLSREVHDRIGQTFTAIKLMLRRVPDDALAPGDAQRLSAAIDEGVETARRISAELRPPLIDEIGLRAALEHLLGPFSADAGLQLRVVVADDQRLDERQSIAAYRIAREAATNVARYAQAGRIAVEGGVDGSVYRLVVADDGRGFDPQAVRAGALGLVGMRERAAAIGARLALDSAPGRGTRVVLEIPLAPQ